MSILGPIIGGDVRPHGDAVPFSPEDIDDLFGWWDASDTGTVFTTSAGATPSGDTDPVGRWEDKSGNGNHLIQATDDNRPVYDTVNQNSLPAILFSGASDNLARTFASTQAQPFSILLAFTLSSHGGVVNIWDSVNSTNRITLYSSATGAGSIRTFESIDRSSIPQLYNTPQFVTATFGATVTDLRRYLGGALVDQDLDAMSLESMDGWLLGARNDGGQNSNIVAYEAMWYNRVLTDGELLTLANYIAGKWDI
jgi:hypothetical protein